MRIHDTLLLCLVAAMGGLLFGYDWVVIGGAKPFYEPFFGLVGKNWEAGFAMSSAIFGCILGAVVFLRLPDRWGRKPSLILASFFFTASAIWTSLAGSLTSGRAAFWSFIGARVLGGLGIGIASNVSPVYIAEVAPAERRGALVSLNQFTIVLGIILAQVANYAIYRLLPENGALNWRIMFGAETVPALLFFILAWLIPESPLYLASRQHPSPSPARQAPSPAHPASGAQHPAPLLGILLLGVFLAAFQQWCGINVVFNYAEDIFRQAGYDVSGVMFNQVITGVVNFAFTLAAMALVDRWGRRPLMLMGAGGLAILYAILGTCYFCGLKGAGVLVVVLLAIACYAMTLAPITWVLLSELFPTRVRGTAMSVAVAALWISCYGLTLTFPPINGALGASGTFWLYGAICLAGTLVIARFVKETKGQELK